MRPVLIDQKGQCGDDFTRKSGLEFRAWPSRRGNRLHYRDGRVEETTHAVQQEPTPKRRVTWQA